MVAGSVGKAGRLSEIIHQRAGLCHPKDAVASCCALACWSSGEVEIVVPFPKVKCLNLGMALVTRVMLSCFIY